MITAKKITVKQMENALALTKLCLCSNPKGLDPKAPFRIQESTNRKI